MTALLTKPTEIFYNAKIITVDPLYPKAEAMAIVGDRILAVGTSEEMLYLASPKTRHTDLDGQVVIPGFNDSHMHLINWGQSMDGVDLTKARSVQDIIELGQEFHSNHPDHEWIIGRGFNDEVFLQKALPTRADLDKISIDRPVFFTRVCGHICIANSKALELGGICANTPDPFGGSIERDSIGVATGVLRGSARVLVRDCIPSPTVDDLKRVLRKACQEAASLGLTTVQSNDLHGAETLNNRLEAYAQLVAADELPIRVNLQACMPTLRDLTAYLEVRKQDNLNSLVTLGPLKLFADGSLGGRTAALSAPYADAPHTSGIASFSQEELYELVHLAAENNLQVAIHAIGDQAIDMVINCYEKAKNAVPAWTARPRIIHCQISRYDQLLRMSSLGIMADIQPIFVPTDLHFVEQRVGVANAEYAYAWKTMNHLGIHTAGGSDSPVESANPLWGMHAAITRQDQNGYPKAGWHPEERLTAMDALALFTIGSAYVIHEETIKGSLSPGKLADFVVLPEDPTVAAAQELLTMKVTATYVGGRKVFG